MKIKALKTKSEAELQQMLKQEREHLRELNFDLASKKLKKVREVRASKKLIARILTLLNEEGRGGVNVISEKNGLGGETERKVIK